MFPWDLWDATSESTTNHDPKIASLLQCQDDREKPSEVASEHGIHAYTVYTQHNMRAKERERERRSSPGFFVMEMAGIHMTNVV